MRAKSSRPFVSVAPTPFSSGSICTSVRHRFAAETLLRIFTHIRIPGARRSLSSSTWGLTVGCAAAQGSLYIRSPGTLFKSRSSHQETMRCGRETCGNISILAQGLSASSTPSFLACRRNLTTRRRIRRRDIVIQGKFGRHLHLRLSVPRLTSCQTERRASGIQKAKSAKYDGNLPRLPSIDIARKEEDHLRFGPHI